MRRLLLLLLTSCALLPTPCFAQFPVTDVGAHALAIKDSLERGWAEVRQWQETVRQIQQDYQALQQAMAMVKNQVTMLTKMPSGMNMFAAIQDYGSQLDGLMNSVSGLSFLANKSTADFDRLYRDSSRVTTAAGRADLQRRMLASRMETARLATQAQAIKGNLTTMYTRLSLLLAGGNLTDGIVGQQQVQLQQAALAQSQQQHAQVMAAIAQRLETQRQAEVMVGQQLALEDFVRNSTLAPIGSWKDGPQLEMTVRGTP